MKVWQEIDRVVFSDGSINHIMERQAAQDLALSLLYHANPGKDVRVIIKAKRKVKA